ncbi:hypothetical protein [Sphingomonas sp. CFBP 8760]|uniref:hypothetical protein n=1 Tax=Sphingomonas sp. CFBP 8760 TaxID=2775282 RepID=UPI001782CD8B|nr:hypothetical protein [Sphingomonas sp. CFBP 8760]MBD8547619.1 hypothetical protein [Sphingomonas sp. CFBP 8760]
MLLGPSDWTYATGATGAVGIAFVAASGGAMLFGMNPVLLVAALSNPALSLLMVRAIQTAEGAMIFGGINVGVQAGGGVAGLVGYMH